MSTFNSVSEDTSNQIHSNNADLDSSTSINLHQLAKRPLWTDEMTIHLFQQIEHTNPFQFKLRTKERGKAWGDISQNIRNLGFDVNKRLVRDKYKVLKEAYTKKNMKRMKMSAIATEFPRDQPEVTQITGNLVEVKCEVTESPTEANEVNNFNEIETNNRTLEEDQSSRNDPRSHEKELNIKKMEMDHEIKRMELELRRQEIEMRRKYEEIRLEKEESDEKRRRKEYQNIEKRLELIEKQLAQQNELIIALSNKLEKNNN